MYLSTKDLRDCFDVKIILVDDVKYNERKDGYDFRLLPRDNVLYTHELDERDNKDGNRGNKHEKYLYCLDLLLGGLSYLAGGFVLL